MGAMLVRCSSFSVETEPGPKLPQDITEDEIHQSHFDTIDRSGAGFIDDEQYAKYASGEPVDPDILRFIRQHAMEEAYPDSRFALPVYEDYDHM